MSARELWLWRHAHADAAAVDTNDMDRTLSTLGKTQAEAAAKHLRAQGAGQARVLCSPAKRTKQTVESLQKQLPNVKVQVIDDVYEASAGQLLALINKHTDAEHLLLVGHNPGLESLVALLSSGSSSAVRGMSTASVARFALPGHKAVEPGGAKLLEFWSP
jgi:phosphohistidine phosphatase